MKKYLKNILLIAFLTLLVGCSSLTQNLSTKNPTNIDENLPTIQSSSIKTISDVNAIALEWKGHNADNVVGYNIYRSNLQKEGQNLKRIASLKNKYVSHYVDTSLDIKTSYLYSISTIGKDEKQSFISGPIEAHTLDTIDSVSFSVAISNMPRQIKVLWRPHSNKAIKYYIIQRSNNEQTKWNTIKKVSNRLSAEFIDTRLKDNYTYYYRIISVTFNNIISNPSKIISATTKALPNSTKEISATKDIARKIILRWQTLDNNNIIGYNIFVSTSSDSYFKKIATTKKDDNTFVHIINEDDQTRYYKIASFDKDGLQSNIKQLKSIMGKTLEVPKVPKITLGLIKGQTVILNWEAGDDRAVSYNVYKTVKENLFQSKTKIFKSVNDTRYEDSDILRGIEYKYEVQAVDTNGLLSKKTTALLLSMPLLTKEVK